MSTAPSQTPRVSTRLSRVLSRCCLVLALALPVLVAGYLVSASSAELVERLQLHATFPGDNSHLQFAVWRRALTTVLGCVPVALTSYGLLCARRCFGSFARGEYFSAQVVRGLRGFAAGIFWSSIAANLVNQPLMSFILTAGAFGHGATVSVGIDSSQLITLIFPALAWQIAAVMERAVALAEENSQFV